MKMRDLSPLEQEKWYAVAVGEIGIPPTDFYEMTDAEMLYAYRGYKKRQENLANIFLLAILRSNSPDGATPFKFLDDGYDIGSLEDREKTFTILNLKED